MDIGGISGAGIALQSTNQDRNNSKKIADSAKQFEALMIGQLLKSAQGSQSWLGEDSDDGAASTAIEMAQEYLGQAIAKGGGLGIAKLVVQGLNRASTPASYARPASSATGEPEQTPPSTDSPH